MNPLQALIEKIDSHIPVLWQSTKDLDRNQFLKVKGSKDTNLYFVTKGCFRLFVENEYEEHTVRLGYQGDFIGALDSFITDEPSPFYIQALKKSQVKILLKKDFLRFIDSDPAHSKLWQDIMAGLIHSQIEREIDILCSSPVERYRRLVQRSPRLFQEVPHKYIAAYLRMTPETLSRVAKG